MDAYTRVDIREEELRLKCFNKTTIGTELMSLWA
jgi:hypothetical protein